MNQNGNCYLCAEVLECTLLCLCCGESINWHWRHSGLLSQTQWSQLRSHGLWHTRPHWRLPVHRPILLFVWFLCDGFRSSTQSWWNITVCCIYWGRCTQISAGFWAQHLWMYTVSCNMNIQMDIDPFCIYKSGCLTDGLKFAINNVPTPNFGSPNW